MKKLLASSLAAVLLLLLPLTTYAASESAIVSNYFYAHANTAGIIPFKSKTGAVIMYGDGIEHDASITAVRVTAQGLASGDKIQVVTDRGLTMNISPDVKTEIVADDWIKINLAKTGTNEAYARLDTMWTHDASNGGTDVTYTFSVNDIPTQYGDLGDGSGGSGSDVPGSYTYFQPKDVYQYFYTAPTGVNKYILRFFNGSGQEIASKTYNNTPSGLHYLTCNGAYQMDFYNGDQLLGSSAKMQTTDIQNATCSSYSDDTAGGINQINLRHGPDMGDLHTITWDPVPGAGCYVSYKNGVQQFTNDHPVGVVVDYDGSAWTVIAKTSCTSSDVLAQGDLVMTNETGTDPTDPGSSCDGCKLLTDMLACPGWSQYMGDLTQAVKNALPPPPDWDAISDKIGAATTRHLADYLGDVPEVPSSQLIKDNTNIPMPSVNDQLPDVAQLTPSMPTDFNSPIPFDIDSGPQIEVKDESKPFNITDPLSGLQIDEPGRAVIPGDPRNNTGGIKQPDHPDTGGMAIPSQAPGETNPMPTPGGHSAPGPVPSSGGSGETNPAPTPRINEAPIPIPKGAESGG